MYKRQGLGWFAAMMLVCASPALAAPADLAIGTTGHAAGQPAGPAAAQAGASPVVAVAADSEPGGLSERRPKSFGQLLKRNLALFGLALGLAGAGLGLVVLMVRRKP